MKAKLSEVLDVVATSDGTLYTAVTDINSDLTLTEITSIPNVPEFTDDVTIDATLSVTGRADITGGAVIGGAFGVSGTLYDLSPGQLTAQSASGSSVSLTKPGYHAVFGATGVTASVPQPQTLPGSMWFVAETGGTSGLMISGSVASGAARVFYSKTGSAGTEEEVGNRVTLSQFGSIAFVSLGSSYVIFAHSGSITIS